MQEEDISLTHLNSYNQDLELILEISLQVLVHSFTHYSYMGAAA